MSNEKGTLLASDEVGVNSRKSWASVVALGLAVASAAGVGFTVGSGKSTSLYSAQDGAQPHYSGERRGNPGDWDDSNAGSRASRDVNYAVETRAPRTGTHAPRNSKFKSEGNHVGEKHDRTTAQRYDESLRSAGAIHKANPTKASRVIIPRRDRSGTKTPQEETHTETNYWANGPGKHVRTGVKNEKAGQHEVHARTAVPKYHGEADRTGQDTNGRTGQDTNGRTGQDTNGMRCEITGMKLDVGQFPFSDYSYRHDLSYNIFYTGVTKGGYSCGDDSQCIRKESYRHETGNYTHQAPRCIKMADDFHSRYLLGLERNVPWHGGIAQTVMVTNSTSPYDGKVLVPATATDEDGKEYWDVSGGGKIDDDYFQTAREKRDAFHFALFEGKDLPDIDLTPPGFVPVSSLNNLVVTSGKLLSFDEAHNCKYSYNPFKAYDCAYTRTSRNMAYDVVDDVLDVNSIALLRRPYLTPVKDADGNMWVFEKDHGYDWGIASKGTSKAPETRNDPSNKQTIEVFPSRAIYDSVIDNFYYPKRSGRTGAYIKMTCSNEDIKTCNEGARSPNGGWLDCACAKTKDIPDDWTFPLVGEIRGEENGPQTTALCVEKGQKPGKDESGCHLKSFSSGANTKGCLEDDACEIVEEDVTCFSSTSRFDRRLFDPKCAMRQNGLSGQEGACALAYETKTETEGSSWIRKKGDCLSLSDVEKEWFLKVMKFYYERRTSWAKRRFESSDEREHEDFEEGYEDSLADEADAQKAFFTNENIMQILTGQAAGYKR